VDHIPDGLSQPVSALHPCRSRRVSAGFLSTLGLPHGRRAG
jgi:hypothetical protein